MVEMYTIGVEAVETIGATKIDEPVRILIASIHRKLQGLQSITFVESMEFVFCPIEHRNTIVGADPQVFVVVFHYAIHRVARQAFGLGIGGKFLLCLVYQFRETSLFCPYPYIAFTVLYDCLHVVSLCLSLSLKLI